MTANRPVRVRSALNYDTDAASEATGLWCTDPSKTRQADAKSADINFIVRQFGLSGTMPQGVRIPTYEDFSEAVEDYQTALNAVRGAQEAFLAVPSEIRQRFNHDPQAFLEYCSDETNLPELRRLGLALPEEVPAKADGHPNAAAAPVG